MCEWKLSTPEDEYSKSPIINDDRKRNYHVLSQAGSQQQLNELSNSPSFPPTAQTHWNQGTVLPWLGQKDERSAKPALLSMVDAVHIACLPYQPSLFSTQHSGSQLQQNRVSEEKVTECKTPMRCVRVCVCVCLPLVIWTHQPDLCPLCLDLLVWWQSFSRFTTVKGGYFRTGSHSTCHLEVMFPIGTCVFAPVVRIWKFRCACKDTERLIVN